MAPAEEHQNHRCRYADPQPWACHASILPTARRLGYRFCVTSHWAGLAAESGVSHELARRRAEVLSGIRYDLCLTLPASPEHPVRGRITIRLQCAVPTDVVLDCTSPAQVADVRVNASPVEPVRYGEHILLPEAAVSRGDNVIEMTFTADDAALNRQADGCYSLFVPARARTAFPCFDQPDLKAIFSLELVAPQAWEAVSNTPGTRRVQGDQARVRFAETAPLPTYLFAFAAGLWRTTSGERRDRTYRVWHLASDADRVAASLDAILDTHAAAVTWLEAYTGIDYPFSQFGIVLIPSFQFSGMEHPGAIYYHADRLLLGPSATAEEIRSRVALIAHETAHIWFGDLVTMRWFDEVWLKEVFANAMAEKILAALHPDEDHGLRFFLATYPAAYAVDRSGGTHAITQPLENLNDAGRLYGPLIYQKAPIVLRQMELLMGAEAFRDGVRRYLSAHRFGTATWDDLVTALDATGKYNLRAWARPWVFHAGRPRIQVTRGQAVVAGPEVCTVRSDDPSGQGLLWQQRLVVTVGDQTSARSYPLEMSEEPRRLEVLPPAQFVLASGGGLGYGAFPLDPRSQAWLLQHVERVPDALTRASAWVTLWDGLLDGAVAAEALVHAALRGLASEQEDGLSERLVGILGKAYWLFLTAPERDVVAPRVEATVAQRLRTAATPAAAAMWLSAFRHVVLSREGCQWLADVWSRDLVVPGLTLSEADEAAIICDLAVREHNGWATMLETQVQRTGNPDLQARLAFIAPALSDQPATRERAFAELAEPSSRRREPWALSRVQWLNHPLRQAFARRFITPGLDMLPELARTGDIFFASRWAASLLGGHGSAAAVALVDEWLRSRQEVSEHLRRNVRVAADVLFSAPRPR